MGVLYIQGQPDVNMINKLRQREKLKITKYFQGRNKDVEVENRDVVTVREREDGTKWETRIKIYTLPRVKYIIRGNLLQSTGSSA